MGNQLFLVFNKSIKKIQQKNYKKAFHNQMKMIFHCQDTHQKQFGDIGDLLAQAWALNLTKSVYRIGMDLGMITKEVTYL